MLFLCYSAICNPRLLPPWQRDGTEEKLSGIHLVQWLVLWWQGLSPKEIRTEFHSPKLDAPWIFTVIAAFGHQLSRSGKVPHNCFFSLFLFIVPWFKNIWDILSCSCSLFSMFAGSVFQLYYTLTLYMYFFFPLLHRLSFGYVNYSFFVFFFLFVLDLRFAPKKPVLTE